MIITGIDSTMIVRFIENSIPVKRAVCVDGKYAITLKAEHITIEKCCTTVRLVINRHTEGLENFTMCLEKGKDFEDIILY